MNIETLKEILHKTTIILDLDEKLREVEDEYYELWLQEGCPDGSSVGQIVDYIIEDNVFDEWFQLGITLLKNRKENEEDY